MNAMSMLREWDFKKIERAKKLEGDIELEKIRKNNKKELFNLKKESNNLIKESGVKHYGLDTPYIPLAATESGMVEEDSPQNKKYLKVLS